MLIAVTDYTHIHTEGEDLGLPKVDGSFRNWFTDFSDFYVCTPAFCAELVLRERLLPYRERLFPYRESGSLLGVLPLKNRSALFFK